MMFLALLVAVLLAQHAACSRSYEDVPRHQLRGRRGLFRREPSPSPPVPPPPSSLPPTSSPVETGECPEPSDGSCTKAFSPVACGPNDCQYNNECIATLAGFVVEEDCKPTRVKPPSCPLPDSETPCILVYAPVQCGPNDCIFDNQCFADAAGYSEAECAASGTPPPEPATCPVPDESEPCTLEYMPVSCGPEGCTYSNRCLAQRAGFADDECSPI
jgi:hypothetical protein